MRDIALEFLAVSTDQDAIKVLTSFLQRSRWQLHCTTNTLLATEYIGRRKLDGVIIDTAVEHGLELVKAIRNGKSNKNTIIFACLRLRSEAGAAIAAGANFIIYKPLVESRLTPIFDVAKPMMEAERRRYFRYNLVAPVQLACGEKKHGAIVCNLSETGMAVRTVEMLPPGTAVEFSFDLPNGPRVKGRGEVIWINSSGVLGIIFHFLAEASHRDLPEWLNAKGC